MNIAAEFTMDQLEEALEAIFGSKLYDHLKSDAHRNIPRDMERAAVKAWISGRPEDEHSAVLRAGLYNLNRSGVIGASAAAQS
jgi:hypothetical protein